MATTVATQGAPAEAALQGDGSGLSHRELLVVLFALLTGLLLAALDQTIVATALPTIVGELGGLEHLSWVVTAYLLTSVASMPLYGKISDLLGRKAVFQFAIVVFLIGSMLSGLAQNMLQLIVLRGVQGIGGGGIMALTFTIVGDLVPPRQRGRYTGYLTGTFALASVAGPLLGGFFVDHLNWRWVFYINLPLGIIALVATSTTLRLPFKREHHRIDFEGAFLLVAAVTCLLLVAVWGGQEYPWSSALIVGLGVASVVLSVLFLLQQRRAPEPIMPLHLFSNSVFTVSVVIGVCVGAAMFGSSTYLPLFLQISTGASATNSGLLLLPLMAGVLIMSIVAGRIISRTGHYRRWPLVGTASAVLGIFLLSGLDTGTSRLESSLAMLAVGAGIGMTMPTLTLAVQNAVPVAHLGVATSALTFFRTLGGTFGVAIFGAVLVSRLDTELTRLVPAGTDGLDSSTLASSPEAIRQLPGPVQAAIEVAMARSISTVFLVAVPIAVLAFAVAWLLREIPLRETSNVEETAAAAPAEPVVESFSPA